MPSNANSDQFAHLLDVTIDICSVCESLFGKFGCQGAPLGVPTIPNSDQFAHKCPIGTVFARFVLGLNDIGIHWV